MILGTTEKPAVISADAADDSHEIRLSKRKRGIMDNIPVNLRCRNHPKRGRPVWFYRDLYQKRGAIERFFSGIEDFKRMVPRYERYVHSFPGFIYTPCAILIGRFLG